ncbi:hypothetical protein AMTR_s00090p00159150 [Amborella trichopoda]|uniref:Uncharacterized protein n=1 Tax=Amborella trichopoda TaxID=13333 RepID=W1P1B3_AMBTC|nr:hypothetical protein AMTR_s00090p00159150 [Amborella trichopoda]
MQGKGSYLPPNMLFAFGTYNQSSQVGVAVDRRDQVGEEKTMQQKYYNTKLITNSPIEVNASKVLTPYAFELLKKEIVQKELYAILQINDKRFIVRH